MWPHGRRLCHCTMYQPGGTPMCSCNWPASGNDAGTSAQYPRPVTSSNRNSSSTSTSIAGTSTDKCNMTSQWYQPMVPNLNFVTDTAPSNSREMRNRAEKLRRDKLNSYIGELATLVPMVSGSAKRMDKTSILRLTATHLRIYYTLLNGATPKSEFNRVNQLALEQLMYEQLEGFLLILTPTGKIVFVSHTVEQMLGHLQTDLMGQSIYTITSSEDHDRLRVHLSPDIIDSEWRRYFKLSLAKAGPRTESPTYEQFCVMGMIRPTVEGRGSKQSREVVQSSSKVNNNVLVFFVKLYRPPPLSDMLIEANKEEYITRHLIDGRIVNCDHRISFVAGYMIEEVSGLSAFKFMHREDVRWTMIALRQMYDRGESVGWSCYRLLSRTGQFIYLRTFGYLEVDNSGVVESFVCVNTLVPEEEGEKLIKEMKERYSVMINASASPQQSNDSEVSNASVEDPLQLEECIKHLITNHLPVSPKTDNCTSPKPSAPLENQDYYLTESPADPHAIEFKHKVTSKVRRVTSDDDDESPGSSMRKRQKRRTVSSSSSESLSSSTYPQDPSTTSTTSSSSPSPATVAAATTTTFIMQSPPPVQQQQQQSSSPHNGNTSSLCRPNVADRMVSSTNSNTVALGS